MDVLESPSYLGKSGARTLFSIETFSGRHIRSHSYFKKEDEILLPPGTYFKVKTKMNPAEGLYIIHLEELVPPFPLLSPPFDIKPTNPLPPLGAAAATKISEPVKSKSTELKLSSVFASTPSTSSQFFSK
jgi:hypothetical protein